jgi:O-antigen/teichoic acid export membrane protein
MKEIIKALFKTGTGSITNLVFNTIALKILAVTLGPYGVGLFSILRQVKQTALSVATMNGRTALVQGASSKKEQTRQDYIQTVFGVFICGSLIINLVLIIFSPVIARLLTGQEDPQLIAQIRWLTIPIFLSALLIYFSALLNIQRALGKLAVVQGSVAIGAALAAYPAAYLLQRGFDLAFIGMMIFAELIGVVLAIIFLYKENLFPRLSEIWRWISKVHLFHFFSFAITLSITGLVSTGTILGIRALIINQQGLHGAGNFDAAWTLSMTYIVLLLTSFQTFYLPTLTRVRSDAEKTELINNILRISTLIMVPVVVSIVVLKPIVIQILYSAEFLPALSIIRWMLIADYLKITAWILAMPMLAFADMRTFFISEVISNIGFFGLTFLAINQLQSIEGVGISFFILYCGYLIFTILYIRKRHKFYIPRDFSLMWIGGLTIIILTSWYTWSDLSVYYIPSAFFIIAAFSFSWIFMGKKGRDSMKSIIYARIRAVV